MPWPGRPLRAGRDRPPGVPRDPPFVFPRWPGSASGRWWSCRCRIHPAEHRKKAHRDPAPTSAGSPRRGCPARFPFPDAPPGSYAPCIPAWRGDPPDRRAIHPRAGGPDCGGDPEPAQADVFPDKPPSYCAGHCNNLSLRPPCTEDRTFGRDGTAGVHPAGAWMALE